MLIFRQTSALPAAAGRHHELTKVVSAMLIFRQTSEIVSPLARSRSISRSSRATSSAVRRFFMGPSLAHSTEGLPFQVDQFLGSRPNRGGHGRTFPRMGQVR